MTETVDPDQARLEATCSCGDSFVSCDVPDDDERAEFDDWQAAHEHCGTGNHGCTFSWCINGGGEIIGVNLEHMSNVEAIPATGMPPGSKHGEILVSLWFQEDLELAPTIQITASDGDGDRAADLRIQEAVILHAHLGHLIQMAIAGTNLDPNRIIEYIEGLG